MIIGLVLLQNYIDRLAYGHQVGNHLEFKLYEGPLLHLEIDTYSRSLQWKIAEVQRA